ncbi:hypothetical protein H2274_07150 [Campylobacter sp. W0049]|uniref:hypothetical protein n=1 Tax=Campylobacter molothri TaxID=1032242 RepID=UPI00301D28DF|nr:hypothetical protein [Campylobacter sp. W0049]
MLNFFLDTNIMFLQILCFFVILLIVITYFKINSVIIIKLSQCLGFIFGIISLVIIVPIYAIYQEEPNKAFLEKINVNDYFSNDYASLGFGICYKNNYTGETCLNYLKYFENKIKEERAEKKEKAEKEKAEKEKAEKEQEEKAKKEEIIKENIEKLNF